MSDVRPLPVWPYPLTAGRAAALKAAKLSMELPYLIVPVPAVPASPGRVLMFGEIPPHVCEGVLIAPDGTEDEERVRAAFEFLLQAPPHAPGLITNEMWLSAVMGMGVKFLYEMVHDPELADVRDLDPAHADFIRTRHSGGAPGEVRFQ